MSRVSRSEAKESKALDDRAVREESVRFFCDEEELSEGMKSERVRNRSGCRAINESYGEGCLVGDGVFVRIEEFVQEMDKLL